MTGRRALVTGAARGQGLAIVRRLQRDGYAVAATDVLDVELQDNYPEGPGPTLLLRQLDVTDETSWAGAVAAVREAFGGLDVLVNNAGVLGRGPLLEVSIAEAERLWRVNCLGHLLGLQAAVPLLREGDRPVVINTLSTAARQAAPGVSAYASSKWAARGLTQAAALELAPLGVRVNAVLPGPVATPMLSPSAIERLDGASLVGRIGQPEDIAEAVAFLASPAAEWMTGSEVTVDGGTTLRRPQ